jgi:hypothetical protein
MFCMYARTYAVTKGQEFFILNLGTVVRYIGLPSACTWVSSRPPPYRWRRSGRREGELSWWAWRGRNTRHRWPFPYLYLSGICKKSRDSLYHGFLTFTSAWSSPLSMNMYRLKNESPTVVGHLSPVSL